MTNAYDHIVLIKSPEKDFEKAEWVAALQFKFWHDSEAEGVGYFRIGALPDLIKPLKFELVVDRLVARSVFGSYLLNPTSDPTIYKLVLSSPQYGAEGIAEIEEGLTYAEAEAAANADYRARVMALFDVGSDRENRGD